ncbi:hypothetical protein HYU13_00155 [Candidatus Woesearchaeota archaeon]|nr:hypothetical protein [Candidatus Woesearchaeota archaeon]
MIEKSGNERDFPIDRVVDVLRKHYHSRTLEYDAKTGIYVGPGDVDLRGIGEGIVTIKKGEAVLKVTEPPARMADAYVVLVHKRLWGGWSLKRQIMQIKGGRQK